MKPNQFDELAKAMALSVTRRAAVKKFGFGLTTLALAALGLTNKAEAAKSGNLPGAGEPCTNKGLCGPGLSCWPDLKKTICRPLGDVGASCRRGHGDCKPELSCGFQNHLSDYGICYRPQT